MSKLKSIYSFIFYSFSLFVIYFMLVFPASGYDYTAGALLAPLILFLSMRISPIQLRYFSLKNVMWMLAYVPYLLYKIIQANIDVALRVLNPKLPINPGFIKVKVDSKDKLYKLMLANSITLTPGTLTCEIKDELLIVHTVDEKAYKNRENVKARFPHYLKEME